MGFWESQQRGRKGFLCMTVVSSIHSISGLMLFAGWWVLSKSVVWMQNSQQLDLHGGKEIRDISEAPIYSASLGVPSSMIGALCYSLSLVSHCFHAMSEARNDSSCPSKWLLQTQKIQLVVKTTLNILTSALRERSKINNCTEASKFMDSVFVNSPTC